MSEESLIVNVVTPEGTRFTHHATSVTVDTVTGPYTVLRNHIAMIVPLKIGAITVKRDVNGKKVTNLIAADSGILEVYQNEVNIVVNTAERARDIDIDRAKLAKEKAEKIIAQNSGRREEAEMKRAEIALSKAINRIGVASRRK